VGRERLLYLYPRAWRKRYGEEFLATIGGGSLHLQQVIDIVSGAIDAWLSADVRRSTTLSRVAPHEGGLILLKPIAVCESKQVRYTTRDSLIGAGVMIGATLFLTMLGIAARRGGWPATGEALLNLSFLGSLTLSMPFWLMKGQPWKAQVVIVGGTFTLLIAIGYLAARIAARI
jgi:hypothetical protein